MSRNRYVSDYHLADSLDERGRIRTEVEYVGSLYSFSAPAEKVRQAKKRSLGLCAAGWVAYIGAMIPLSAASTSSSHSVSSSSSAIIRSPS